MSHNLWRFAGLLAVAICVGFVTDSYALWLLFALVIYLIWHFCTLQNLIDWLDNKKESPPTVDGGYIDRIIDEFDSLHVYYRKRNERLSGYLKQFQQATNALPDAIVVLNRQGKILGANIKAGEYLNIHWPQDSGQRVSNLLRHPEFNDYLNVLEIDTPQQSLELSLPHHPHNRLEFRIVPFGDTQRLLIARDITPVHHASEMRKDFIANASHELRSPLTVIAGYLESFDGDSDECPESWQPIIHQMRNQTARMQRLIEDLLQLSSLESSESSVIQETIRVAELLFAIYKEAETISGSQEHIFYLETDPELCLIGNQREIYSAFSNLIFNAVQYTPSRGVIRIRWYQDEEGAHMQVSDTGEGIPAEHISRLTERFYRVDKGRSREQGGTGLGLAIVKHILVRHNASLHIESVYGTGSTFRCDFPEESVTRKDSTDVGMIA